MAMIEASLATPENEVPVPERIPATCVRWSQPNTAAEHATQTRELSESTPPGQIYVGCCRFVQ